MTQDEYVQRLVHLPNTRLTPEVLLHQVLNDLGDIKAVAIVIQRKDETFDCDWSQMRVSELCMASMSFQDDVMKTVKGEQP